MSLTLSFFDDIGLEREGAVVPETDLILVKASYFTGGGTKVAGGDLSVDTLETLRRNTPWAQPLLIVEAGPEAALKVGDDAELSTLLERTVIFVLNGEVYVVDGLGTHSALTEYEHMSKPLFEAMVKPYLVKN